MRTRVAAALTALATLAAVAGVASVPAGAQTPVPTPSEQAFGAYGTGSIQSVNVLQLGQTQALNIQTAFAGQSTNSQGLPSGGINNQMGYIVQPTGLDSQNAYGRGTGLEVGLLNQPAVDPNQILLSGLAQASAPPPVADSPKQIGPVTLGGVAFARLLRGQAGALFDPDTCVIGRAMSFGEGEAAGVQLLGTPNPLTGELLAPVLGTTLPATDPDPRNTNRSRSVSYLRPNGDGTFGVVSETRQTIAPIALLGGQINLELLGEWALRVIATGKPNGSIVEYAPVGAGPTTPVLNLTIGGSTTTITFQQLLGPNGFNLAGLLGGLSALLNITIGTPPTNLAGNGAPALAADGTSASAAVDVLRITLLSIPNVLQGADIRVGHMEGAAVAPAGGVICNVPVAKVGRPDPITAGQDFTIEILIPSDAAVFEELFGCDLIGIRVVDVHEIESGNPSYTITGASNGGVITRDGTTTTITWANIGNYTIGDPPIVLTVTGNIPAGSAAGVLKDTAVITATLGNCRGQGGGDDIVGQAIGGGSVTGVFTLIGPDVTRGGGLPSTGGDERLLLVGGAFLLAALAVRRRLRRAEASITSG